MATTATAGAEVRQLAPRIGRRRRFGDGSPTDVEKPFIGNGHLAVLMLVATEAMLFSGLIGSFLVFKLSAPFWPPPGMPRLPIAVTWINTFILLTSAATMVM